MIEFIDTFALVAFVDRRDSHHGQVMGYLKANGPRMLMTEWIVLESLDSLATPRLRGEALQLIDGLRLNPDVEIVSFDGSIYRVAFDLYRNRSDKGWSLTDCTSFVVMEQRKLTRALTADNHFRQAGFTPVFHTETQI
jgi:uncharacterized protein